MLLMVGFVVLVDGLQRLSYGGGWFHRERERERERENMMKRKVVVFLW